MEDVSLEFGLGDQRRFMVKLYLGSSVEYVQNMEEIQCPKFMVEKFPGCGIRDLNSNPSSESHLLCAMLSLSCLQIMENNACSAYFQVLLGVTPVYCIAMCVKTQGSKLFTSLITSRSTAEHCHTMCLPKHLFHVRITGRMKLD